jgi:hypothetical protein
MIERIKNIRKYGKTAQGQKELIKHLEGGKLTLRQAALANCYFCLGFYADGKIDCAMSHCPLHPFMPYNANRTKRTGKILTAEHKQKMRAARQR